MLYFANFRSLDATSFPRPFWRSLLLPKFLKHLLELVGNKRTSKNSGFDLRENLRRQVAVITDFVASHHAAYSDSGFSKTTLQSTTEWALNSLYSAGVISTIVCNRLRFRMR